MAYVTRNWARDEHAFIWSDFIDTVKGNWKYGLLTGFITGMVPLLMYVCVTFYGEMANTNLLFMIPQVICIMIGVLWLCSLMYIYPQIVTYKLNYRNVLRNRLIMTIGRLPITVGLKLLSLLPWVIAALVALFTPYMQYALMGLAVYYIVIGFGLSRFVGASYSNAVFDRYINPNIEGAQVGRGLYNARTTRMKRTTAEKPANEEHAFVTTYPRKGGKDMGKKDELLTGAIRRDALTRLTREERMKYELARELGLLDRVRQVGWAGLSAKETGRIGGLIGQSHRRKP